MEHTGPGHPDVTLSLTEKTPDGGLLYQSWTICGCTIGPLRQRLGPPAHESYATREQVLATGRAVVGVPGVTHLSGGDR